MVYASIIKVKNRINREARSLEGLWRISRASRTAKYTNPRSLHKFNTTEGVFSSIILHELKLLWNSTLPPQLPYRVASGLKEGSCTRSFMQLTIKNWNEDKRLIGDIDVPNSISDDHSKWGAVVREACGLWMLCVEAHLQAVPTCGKWGMSEILELRLPSCAVSWWAFVLSTPRPRGQMINCSCPVSGLIKHLQELLKPQTVLGEVSPIEVPLRQF